MVVVSLSVSWVDRAGAAALNGLAARTRSGGFVLLA